MDIMFSDADVYTACNGKLEPDLVVPEPEHNLTGGRPFVQTLRDCREEEEDGTLTFWQTQKLVVFQEEYAPGMRVGRARFTTAGMLGTGEAMVRVPESCEVCKGLVLRASSSP